MKAASDGGVFIRKAGGMVSLNLPQRRAIILLMRHMLRWSYGRPHPDHQYVDGGGGVRKQ